MTPLEDGRLFHLALAEDWTAALAAGAYRRSTRGLALEEVGFVHLSLAHQWRGVRDRFYADLPDDALVLLEIDPGRLGVPVRLEPGVPDDPAAELFPHAYGPVPVDAVVAVHPLALAP